jgi:hypothetical protein
MTIRKDEEGGNKLELSYLIVVIIIILMFSVLFDVRTVKNECFLRIIA